MKTTPEALLVFAIAVALSVAAVALGPELTEPGWETLGGIEVWTDPKTGCRYNRGAEGMSPLVGPDGKPDCARRP